MMLVGAKWIWVGELGLAMGMSAVVASTSNWPYVQLVMLVACKCYRFKGAVAALSSNT